MARKNDGGILDLILISFKTHCAFGYVLGLIFFFLPELIYVLFAGNFFISLYISIFSIFFKIAGVLFIIGGTYSLMTNPKNESFVKAVAAVGSAAFLALAIGSFFHSGDTEKPVEGNKEGEKSNSELVRKNEMPNLVANSSVAAAASAVSTPQLESLEYNSKERWDRLGFESTLNRSLRPFQVKWNQSGTCQIKGLSDAMSLPGRKYNYILPTEEQKRQIYSEQYPYVVDAFNHGCVVKLNAFELQNKPVYSKYLSVKSQISSEERCAPYFSSIDTATLSAYTDGIKIKHLSDILYDASVKQCLSKRNPLL